MTFGTTLVQRYQSLNSGYKIYAKIITQCFEIISETILLEEQNRIRTGRSCIHTVFTIKQITEKRREFNLETHMAFLDLEKAFDKSKSKPTMAIPEEKRYTLPFN